MSGNDDGLKRSFYDTFASQFDKRCLGDRDEHWRASKFIAALSGLLGIRTVLDVGCGTGRGMVQLGEARPELAVFGVEPQAAMLAEAQVKDRGAGCLLRGNGAVLPVRSNSVDAACAFGVLHHDRHPERLVSEMMRVSRQAIFISDSNRLGQGHVVARYLKLTAWSLHLWPLVNWIKTRGRGYTFTPGDGYIFSYSVYDSIPLLMGWADNVFVVPTVALSHRSRFHPALNWSHGLLCAIRSTRE